MSILQKFEYVAVPRSPGVRAAGLSLVPLLSLVSEEDLGRVGGFEKAARSQGYLARLAVGRWRKLAFYLKQAGWLDLVRDKQLIYAVNCPPATALTRPRTYPCRRVTVCPHCWARNVRKLYDEIANLVEIRTDAVVTGLVIRHEFPIGYVDGTLQAIYNYVTDEKPRLLRAGGFEEYGAVVGFTILPMTTGWALEQRLLVVAPRGLHAAGEELELAELTGFSVPCTVRGDTIERGGDLVSLVGTTLAYPSELMTADTKLVAEVLSYRQAGRQRAVRMFERYGELRGRSADEAAETPYETRLAELERRVANLEAAAARLGAGKSDRYHPT